MTLNEARRFSRFDLFYAGQKVLHLRLSSMGCSMAPAVDKPVLQRPPESFGLTPSWDFTYGTCDAGPGEGGCAPPVDIQENESCWDNLSAYAGHPPRLTRLRGVPSTRTYDRGDGFGEVELYTRLTTVTIDAPTVAKALRVSEALRGVNLGIDVKSALPAPSKRTLDGRMRCVGKLKPIQH
jgi:hypothetical protein